MKLELYLDDHELEITEGLQAYLEDSTYETCRPWSKSGAHDEEPALTPQMKQELSQIIRDAEALYSRAKVILTPPNH